MKERREGGSPKYEAPAGRKKRYLNFFHPCGGFFFYAGLSLTARRLAPGRG